jgi:hypothetical protein
MIVTFEYCEDDFVNMFHGVFSDKTVRTSASNFGWIGCIIMFGAFTYITATSRSHGGPVDWAEFIPVGLMIMALIGFQLLEKGRWISRLFVGSLKKKASDGLSGRCQVEITPEYVRMSTHLAELTMPWRNVGKVEEDKGYVHFSSAPNTPTAACFVPQRAFATPELADLFLRTARAYWKGEPPPAEELMDQEATVWPPPPQIGS